MNLFPAIDLRGGKIVRLTQGDYDRMTVYGEDPCAQARQFVEAGARYLHVVDLDGAKDGTLSNYKSIAALAEQAARLGKTVAYPVCGENFTLTAAVPGPDGWEMGAYGIRTPVLERAALIRPEALDLVLVPCTAFDAVCRRVGMGKGYYDRYLPRCRNAVALGVAFEAQRVPEAAADEQDWQLDGFVTERKVYRGTDEFEL